MPASHRERFSLQKYKSERDRSKLTRASHGKRKKPRDAAAASHAPHRGPRGVKAGGCWALFLLFLQEKPVKRSAESRAGVAPAGGHSAGSSACFVLVPICDLSGNQNLTPHLLSKRQKARGGNSSGGPWGVTRGGSHVLRLQDREELSPSPHP